VNSAASPECHIRAERQGRGENVRSRSPGRIVLMRPRVAAGWACTSSWAVLTRLVYVRHARQRKVSVGAVRFFESGMASTTPERWR
jgi:hypothetical protein